ncbi:hypothetical protein [Hydrogenoanaerobacterium sp.]|uniref:hypothetical protein n=1 Tax=Hydrogenoanaerobacterium sp. TaxID=2953763 RepID=UPI00289AD4F1|nr:hypothetical protein [Hydrogenoanaerobacterium sp.]
MGRANSRITNNTKRVITAAQKGMGRISVINGVELKKNKTATAAPRSKLATTASIPHPLY